jgi:hypothetical protein
LSGLFDLAMALFHATFWRRFGWPARLAHLDSVDRGILQVANLALIGQFTVIGAALVIAPAEAVATLFGRCLLGGLCVFWLARAAVQARYFGLRHPASKTLALIFVLGAVLHGLPFVLRGAG